MSGDITTDAVRAALGMHELQARIASINVANAGRPEARAIRADFGQLQGVLADVAGRVSKDVPTRLAQAEHQSGMLVHSSSNERIAVDEEIAQLVVVSANYQSLTEALSRHFGIMRLAVAGRS